jgi:(p)ppGpp synthase/HD superfamily hydrolase
MISNYRPIEAQEFEKAVLFLVRKIMESGNNSKPVVFHSIRVGVYLSYQDYPAEVIIAGLLHDLLEDSKTSEEELAGYFGKKVAELVKAVSFDRDIQDKKQRYHQTLAKGIRAGKDALVIKAADILDNSFYYRFTDSQKSYDWLVSGKLKHFVENTKDIIGNEKVWQELNVRLSVLSRETFSKT